MADRITTSAQSFVQREVVDLAARLRSNGFAVDTRQCFSAHTLLIEVASKGFEGSRQICGWLAPIFCTTPEEQGRFEPIFREWWGVAEVGQQRREIKYSTEKSDTSGVSSSIKQGSIFNRISPVLFLLSFAALLGAGSLTYIWILRLGSSNQTQGSLGDIIVSTGRVTAITMSLILIAFLVATGFLWWLWIKRQRLLQRWRAAIRHQIHPFMVKGATEHVVQLLDLHRIAQDLRRHRAVNLYDLHPESTVIQSIRNGLFSPAYESRKALPEYLVLIDRLSFADQLASLETEIVDRLMKYDVIVDRFYFQADPRVCRKDKPVPLQFSLRDLAASYSHRYLLMFTDANAFFDPLQGTPQRWLDLFSPWLNRGLFTPLDDPSNKSEVLSKLGFVVFPPSREGIRRFIDAIGRGGESAAVRRTAGQDFPQLLSERPSRWLESHDPPSDLLNKLSAQLRNYLGHDGYFWLSACAVYPMLQWELTLYLGYKLINQEVIKRELSRLVRLPWFRHGTMPDWLRRKLILDLSARDRLEIRRAIYDLLMSSISNQDVFVLPIATREINERSKNPSRSLRQTFTAWKESVLLRSMLLSEPDDSALREQVFLTFMLRRRFDELSVPLPQPALRTEQPFLVQPSLLAQYVERVQEGFKALLEKLFRPRTEVAPRSTHVTTYFVRGMKYAFTSAFAIFAGYLMQNPRIDVNDLLILAIPVIASLFFFVCYANRFQFGHLYVTRDYELQVLLQSEAIRIFPLIAVPIIVIILLVITRTERLSVSMLAATMIYAVLYYLYGIFLLRYKPRSDDVPLVRHQLIWPVILSIAIGLYFGRFLTDLKFSMLPLFPVGLLVVFYLVSESLQFSGRQFLATSLLMSLLLATVIVLTQVQVLPVNNTLIRTLAAMLFCVAISAYLAVFESWKITADIAERENITGREGSDQFLSSKASQYATATLSALVITIGIVPFVFIFSDYGTFFLVGFTMHAFLSFIFWFYFGREPYFKILPWSTIKTVAGLAFLALLVTAPLFNQTIVPNLLGGFGLAGLGLLMTPTIVQTARLAADFRRISSRKSSGTASDIIRLLDRRINLIRILSVLCLIASFVVVFLQQSVDNLSLVFKKGELALAVYAMCILFCFLLEILNFIGLRPYPSTA